MTGELTSWGLARGLALVKGGGQDSGQYVVLLNGERITLNGKTVTLGAYNV